MEPEEANIIKEQDNTAFIAKQPVQEPVMKEHLDSSKMLERLKMMLLGYEYDNEEDEWKPAEVVVGYDKEGKEIKETEGPLMDPKEVRVIIGSLSMYLDQNTFLSRFKEDRINDIMYGICINLYCKIGYALRHKMSPPTRDIIFGSIEHSILSALLRADNKITLDALSKMQHSIEHIQATPQQAKAPEQKDFKFFG